MNQITSFPMKPTTKLLVMLGAQGTQLLSPPNTPVYILQFHELVTLSELDSGDHLEPAELASRVATSTGVGEDVIQKFLSFLTRSGRLRRRRFPIPVRDLEPSTILKSTEIPSFSSSLISLKVPLTLRICGGLFQLIDHDGRLLVGLSAAELITVAQFVQSSTLSDGLKNSSQLLAKQTLKESRLVEIVSCLFSAGLISTVEDEAAGVPVPRPVSYKQALKKNFSQQAAELDKKEVLRQQQTGVYRTKVIPVSFGEGIPAALGLVMSYAKVYHDGSLDEFYDFRLDWVWDDDKLESFTSRPAIYLFSNYLWTHEKSIAVSATVKRLSPGSITIHGGPDTPKYAGDAKAYFDKFPHVDIIIRGEGEASAADTLDKLRSVIGQENPDLSVLEDVAGISYRFGGEIVRNPDRERIEDLDTIPSPYLMGLFDAYRGVPRLHVTLETNRGCPYGCTFCDWGSATTSKIRKFDLDRVFGELEWCSNMKVQSVSQADANFGVFERDVAIAERVAELKKSTGYPETFGGSYAKNSTKYLRKIIKVMADAGILAQGVLSLQTMDDNTLSVVNRSNIKVEKYDALANEMRNSNLQLSVELMMGLPGATLNSFIEDLQQCINREIQARINHTTMLVNSPMNSPEYRAEHQIVTGTEIEPGKMPVLVSTKTFTREDLATMVEFRQLYIFLDNFGVMRLCARFMRQQTGLTEMEFYKKLLFSTGKYEQQHLWPMLNTLVNYGHHLMAPPYSWALVFAELREFLVQECGVPDDGALDTILKTQLAILPTHGRVFPHVVALKHDVVAWNAQMLAAKAAGHWCDWQMEVPPLSSFGPGRLEVNDVNGSVTKLLGCHMDINARGVSWDMDSGMERAKVEMDFNVGFMDRDDIIAVA